MSEHDTRPEGNTVLPAPAPIRIEPTVSTPDDEFPG